MNNNLRQIIYDMRTQPVIAWVTIIGTALSIFLIMTVVMLQQVYLIPFAPETHRERMLYGCFFHVEEPASGNSSSASLGYDRAKQLYSNLEGVEEVSFMHKDISNYDLKGTTGEAFSGSVRKTDEAFWRIYEYPLLAGRYYTPEEIEANSRVAVVSEGTARRLFGGEHAVGQHFLLDHNDFEVIGVVKDASRLATMAFGEVFVPIHTDGSEDYSDMGMGPFCAALLVKEGVDFESVRSQVKARYAQADTEMAPEGRNTVYHGSPFDQETVATGLSGSNTTPDNTNEKILNWIIYAVLLLVPAINLSSMLHSRLRRRISDIGVRRAFGCTKGRIIRDIITENLMVTLAGGLIGLGAGVLFALFYDGLYTTEDGDAVRPALSMILNLKTTGIAFGACFILNLISASIPAWQAARVNPVNAINAK